jgi:hypothetical protein
VSNPRFPDQQDDVPDKQPISRSTKAIVAVVVLALVVMIALHVGHVFG